jgi:hypothetical protein
MIESIGTTFRVVMQHFFAKSTDKSVEFLFDAQPSQRAAVLKRCPAGRHCETPYFNLTVQSMFAAACQRAEKSSKAPTFPVRGFLGMFFEN